MKILFLLHALLKEIQECLPSYQSQEFFAVNGLHLCEATIASEDIGPIVEYLTGLKGAKARWSSLASSAVAFAALAQDVAAGRRSFNKCLACHAIGAGAKNKIGPRLNGLDGRRDRLI